MGEAFRATDIALGREEAIKVLLEAFHNEPERLATWTRLQLPQRRRDREPCRADRGEEPADQAHQQRIDQAEHE